MDGTDGECGRGVRLFLAPAQREGQTVTLCQPDRTPGRAMLNTISRSANGRSLWCLGYVFVCVPWSALKCVRGCVHLRLCMSLPCTDNTMAKRGVL